MTTNELLPASLSGMNAGEGYDEPCCHRIVALMDKCKGLVAELAAAREEIARSQYRNEDGDLYTAKQLADLLNDRDAFLASKGLFTEYADRAGTFCAQLSTPEPSAVTVTDE